jgi:hypothetical protein
LLKSSGEKDRFFVQLPLQAGLDRLSSPAELSKVYNPERLEV